MHKKLKNKLNPFLGSFIYHAAICCLIVGTVFLLIFHRREITLHDQYLREKMDLVLTDLETQLETLDLVSIHLSQDKQYYYSTFMDRKYKEYELVQAFKDDYRNSLGITKDIYIYYKDGNSVFHSTGYLVGLEVYLKDLTMEAYTELIRTMNSLNNEYVKILSLTNGIYILMPFNAASTPDSPKAILGAFISFAELERRFKIICGGLDGTVALYTEEQLLYCSDASSVEMIFAKNSENVLTASSEESIFTLKYLPEQIHLPAEYLGIQYFLIVFDVLLIFILALLFAERAYRPLKELRSKYQQVTTLSDKTEYRNVFEEMSDVIQNALQNNIFSAKQISQMQEILKQNLLNLLLTSFTPFPEIQTYLNQLGIALPGPHYYVICITAEEAVTESDMLLAQKDIEYLSNPDAGEYIYAVCNQVEKQIWVICSLANACSKESFTEYVQIVAQDHFYNPNIGIGNTYQSLDNLSASFLESLDNLGRQKNTSIIEQNVLVYDNSHLRKIEDMLSIGALENALKELDVYVHSLEDHYSSLLMQQYIHTDFLSFISHLSCLNKIKLSNQNISLLVTAKDIHTFRQAAEKLLKEYYDKAISQSQTNNIEECVQICNYIKEHFMEYDTSIEIIAKNLNVTTAIVREAVQMITGKMYKDYVVSLRMEYAKQLMQETDLSIADISLTVGYSSVSYFIRTFKIRFGITPAQYKKNLLKC